jgi:hypothetical protein
MREHGFLLACAIAAFILAGMSASAAYASYRYADIERLSAFVAEQQGGECGRPSVVAALSSAVNKSPNAISWAALVVQSVFSDTFEDAGAMTHLRFSLLSFQRQQWSLLLFSRQQILQAYCNVGATGAVYTMPKIGKILGLGNIAGAPPAKLQALADVYVLDMRIHWRPEQIRKLYWSRLRFGRQADLSSLI